jgi:hypothetical protein
LSHDEQAVAKNGMPMVIDQRRRRTLVQMAKAHRVTVDEVVADIWLAEGKSYGK